MAVISDVHANLPALQSVLADIDDRGVDQLVVAGDVVGFGPAPSEVVDTLRARRAAMIRGNHEKDYVTVYHSGDAPAWWRTSPRLISFRWQLERLGADRRAYLAGLPDRLLVDDCTLVVHGSPRHARDAVLPWTPDDELEAMYAGESASLVFMGHTHRPHVRQLASRRLANVGSVGMPLDGDPRASYFLVEGGCPAGDWTLENRRVDYDVEAHLAGFQTSGLAELDAPYVELMRRQLRAARDYYGPWFRFSKDIPDDEAQAAMWTYLAANP